MSTGDPDADAAIAAMSAPPPAPRVTGDPDADSVIHAHNTAAKAKPAKFDWTDYWTQQAKDEAEANTGAAETVLHGATAGVGSLGGGLNFLGTLAATRGDVGAARAVQEDTQRALTYQPRTAAGQGASSVLDTASQYTGAKEGEAAGDYILDKTNSPFLAATANTLANVPQFVVGAKVGKGARAAEEPIAPATAEAATVAPKYATETKAAPSAEASPAVAERAKILRSVGFDNARTSALTNDGPSAMSEYQTSKDPTTPQGLAARDVFDNEKKVLNSHAAGIVDDTGGSKGLDNATLESRGNTILKPFEELQEHFDTQRKAAYAAADEKMAGQPVPLKGFQETLNDESNLTNSDRVGLKSGLTAYLKKLNMVGEDGSVAGSGVNAETVRKYINENWSPANSKFAGALKDSLDNDVTKAAGSDVYKSARKIVTDQKNTLENPDGIGRVLDASGPNGINRKVPAEKVADNIVNLPNAQLKHITDTLDSMPADIQESAQGARAELQAHMASRLQEAGNKHVDAWGHKEVNSYLDKNSGKLPLVFGEDSPAIAKMQNLRAAGNILRVDRSYPGAAIQGRILQSKIIPGAVGMAATAAGEGVGNLFGIPHLGGMAGAATGGAVGLKMSQRAGVKAVQKRMTDLSDVK